MPRSTVPMFLLATACGKGSPTPQGPVELDWMGLYDVVSYEESPFGGCDGLTPVDFGAPLANVVQDTFFGVPLVEVYPCQDEATCDEFPAMSLFGLDGSSVADEVVSWTWSDGLCTAYWTEDTADVGTGQVTLTTETYVNDEPITAVDLDACEPVIDAYVGARACRSREVLALAAR